MKKGFWETLPWPIIGLAPVDGVTDAAFRYIVAKYGRPDIIITEFTSVEGIRAGATRLLDDFIFSSQERPIVAQLFGADPAAFFIGAVVAAALGFDGIDINMGCPAKNVTGFGAGAALILDPARAKDIIRQTKAGAQAWSEGLLLSELTVSSELISLIEARQKPLGLIKRDLLPVSVKTRLGYSDIVIEDWVSHLLEVEPVNITIHGRTLKQLYSGNANWEAIAQAARIIHTTPTTVIGNGDIHTLTEAQNSISKFGVDGVLIGRAAFGNPWLFQNIEAPLQQRLGVALEHARYFSAHFPPRAFVRMRKHLLDYIRGFEGAKDIRVQLMKVTSLQEVESILEPLLIGS